MSSHSVKRGQIHVIDFVVSVSAFMLLVAFAYVLWASTVDKLGGGLEERSASWAANRAMLAIVYSTGEPSGWAVNISTPGDSGLKAIGTASSPYVLDRTKLLQAASFYNSSLTYNATRVKMGIAPYDADIRIMYPNGTSAYVFGTPPNSTHIVLASASRQALLGTDLVWARVRIWKPQVP